MRRALATLALVLLGSATSPPAFAVEPFPTVMIEGASRVQGETRWTFSLWRRGFGACSSPPHAGDVEPDGGPLQADCVNSVLVVKNESARPIQCKLAIDVPAAANPRERHVEALHVVLPGTETAGVSVTGEAAEVPHSFSATCRIMPERLTVDRDAATQCKLKLQSPRARAYYPVVSRERGDQGDTILEFALDPKTRKVVDPMVVASSGFADLDNGALDLSKGILG